MTTSATQIMGFAVSYSSHSNAGMIESLPECGYACWNKNVFGSMLFFVVEESIHPDIEYFGCLF